MCCVGVVGMTYTAESASFDGTRWHVAELAMKAGYSERDIFGSYEWVGYRLGRAPRVAPSFAEQKAYHDRYYNGLCVSIVITDSTPGAKSVVIAQAQSHGLLRKAVTIYALRNPKVKCASGK